MTGCIEEHEGIGAVVIAIVLHRWSPSRGGPPNS
jgi:hypothetical protein